MTGAELRVAIVVDAGAPLGELANTVAVLSIGLGAAQPDLAGVLLTDRRGRTISNTSSLPVPVLQASSEDLARLVQKASSVSSGRILVAFPRFARSLHDFAEYQREFKDRDLGEETIEGIGLCGPAKWVRSLTGNLRLLK